MLEVKINKITDEETKASLAKDLCIKEMNQKLHLERSAKFYFIKRK